MIEWVELVLNFVFSIIDMGLISFYLGLKVQWERENQMIRLSQPTYINKVFNKFYLDKAYAVNKPIKETALFE